MDQMMKRRLASEERPWMKYYPPQMVEGMEVPHCTLRAYLEQNMPGRPIRWPRPCMRWESARGTGFLCSCSRCRSFCICCWPQNR